MTQEQINKIFQGSLGQQCSELFTTSDDRVFIRHEEAELHTQGKLDPDTKPLDDQTIKVWYEDYSLFVDQKQAIILCDPCYLFDNNNPEHENAWEELINQFFSCSNSTIFEYKGAKVLCVSTAYGDGSYKVETSLKSSYDYASVDAGLLCFVTLEDAKKINPDVPEKEAFSFVVIEDFEGKLEVNSEEHSLHGFDKSGKEVITCLTDDEDEEELDECYYCGCEYEFGEGYGSYCSTECYDIDNEENEEDEDDEETLF